MRPYSKYVKTSDIRKTRKQKKMSANKIATEMGFSSICSYYNLETGLVEPRISQMVRLSQILDEPVKNFFNI